MVFLNASHTLWSSSRKTLTAMALAGALVIAGNAGTNSAFAQDAVEAQANRTDAQIQADVLQKLATSPGLTSQKMAATTSNGIVTLTGSVTDEVTRQIAENAASSIAGVKSVNNRLSVGDVPPALAGDNAPPDTKPDAKADASADTNQPQQGPAPASPAATPQAQPGTNSGWGPAGPPPDAVNGQVPPQPTDTQTQTPPNGTTYGAPVAPGYSQRAYPQQQGSYPNNGYPNNAYPNNGYPYPNQAPARPSYQSSAPMSRPYIQPKGPVTIPPETMLTVRLENPIDARRVQPGDVFVANAARDVFENGILAVPLGATLEGRVVAVKKPGAFAGGGDIQVELTQLYLNGQAYPIVTDAFSTYTPGKGASSAANTIGGTAFGALLGAAIGGGPGAAIGAVAGGASGAALSTASGPPRSFIPAETMITFHLKAPAVVQPVSQDEAIRLASSMPHLVRRPAYYGPPPGYYGYPYYR